MQRVPDGEVSTFLCDDLQVGDAVRLRGPVGGWFVWRPGQPGPVLLVAGGSGVVPLMAMIRARPADGPPFRLVYSAREPDDVLHRDELARLAASGVVDVGFVFTRRTPDGAARAAGPAARRRPRSVGVDRGRRAHLLRLRSNGFRRGRGHPSHGGGPRPGSHPDRAIRAQRPMSRRQ